MDYSQYINEFLTIAVVHFLAVASPGPDFAIIVKQSLTRGRRTALYTSVGIGCAILLHVTYSLIGIGLLIASNPLYFKILSYLAAAYLFYIGISGIKSKPASHLDINEKSLHQGQSFKKGFLTGFLVNGLNVKATLFFVSLFSLIISTNTPIIVQSIYGIYMAIATAAWFSFLSIMLTMKAFRQRLIKHGYIIDRLMGIVLILLAIKIVVS